MIKDYGINYIYLLRSSKKIQTHCSINLNLLVVPVLYLSFFPFPTVHYFQEGAMAVILFIFLFVFYFVLFCRDIDKVWILFICVIDWFDQLFGKYLISISKFVFALNSVEDLVGLGVWYVKLIESYYFGL